MSVAPIDLKNLGFKKSFRGYSRKDVDKCLEDVSKSFNKLYSEIEALKKDNSRSLEQLEHYRAMESSLSQTMVMAQQSAKEIVDSANKSAKDIVESAESKAKDILDSANSRSKEIIERANTTFQSAEKTLELADKTSSEIIDLAALEAAKLREDAKTQADFIIFQAERESEQLLKEADGTIGRRKNEIAALRQKRDSIKRDMELFLEKKLEEIKEFYEDSPNSAETESAPIHLSLI